MAARGTDVEPDGAPRLVPGSVTLQSDTRRGGPVHRAEFPPWGTRAGIRRWARLTTERESPLSYRQFSVARLRNGAERRREGRLTQDLCGDPSEQHLCSQRVSPPSRQVRTSQAPSRSRRLYVHEHSDPGNMTARRRLCYGVKIARKSNAPGEVSFCAMDQWYAM
ncbi:hypothetical protein GCM10020229_60170 [Kitasatospora albolonga]